MRVMFLSPLSITISVILFIWSRSLLKMMVFLPFANLSSSPVFSAVFKLNKVSEPILAASIPICISVSIFICILWISFCFCKLDLRFSLLFFNLRRSLTASNSLSIFSSSSISTSSTSTNGFESFSSMIPNSFLACFLHLINILKSFLPKTFKSLQHSINSVVVCFIFFKIFHSESSESIWNILILPKVLMISSSCLTQSNNGIGWKSV